MRRMKNKYVFIVHSTFENYENESSDRKRNTVRFNYESWPEWKKEWLRTAKVIKVYKGYTKDWFIRNITNKTIFNDVAIISW